MKPLNRSPIIGLIIGLSLCFYLLDVLFALHHQFAFVADYYLMLEVTNPKQHFSSRYV